MRRRVFIGSSGEAMAVCRALQQEFDRDHDATVWDQNVFLPTHDAIDSLWRALNASEFGVFVLTPDDVTRMRGEDRATARDNVIFELGLFLGRLGRSRTFMVVPKGTDLRLPTDLGGATVVHYDSARFNREPRGAVGPTVTRIVQAMADVPVEVVPESDESLRLGRALTRMSHDLEWMLGYHGTAFLVDWPKPVTFPLGRATVHLEVGRIQDQHPTIDRQAVVLPANEYFDDGCINDASGSLGAYVARHFAGAESHFRAEIEAQLADRKSRRVLRGRQAADSYGVGEALFLSGLAPDYRIILASVTTEREGVGLHAEPHFLYAAYESIVRTMNEFRFNAITLPVLGSGHGEISLNSAIVFNLLALRATLNTDSGRHVKNVRFVVFDGDAAKIEASQIGDVVARMAHRVGSA